MGVYIYIFLGVSTSHEGNTPNQAYSSSLNESKPYLTPTSVINTMDTNQARDTPARCFPSPEDKPTAWVLNTLFMLLKEFTAVTVHLVCFSRVGATTPDYLTGALILYMMLVAFGFPFMSGYLFFVLKLGPWTANYGNWQLMLRTVAQIGLVVSAQLLGAFTAYHLVNDQGATWASAGPVVTTMPVDSATPSPTQYTTWLYNSADNAVNTALPGLEEGIYTLIFLVGLLHLLEADAEGLMFTAFFNDTEQTITTDQRIEEYKNSQVSTDSEQARKVNERLDQILELLQQDAVPTSRSSQNSVGSSTPPINLKPSMLLSNADRSEKPSARRTDDAGKKYTKHSATLITFILHVCVLLAGTTRAFPTAHGTPAITLYLYLMNLSAAGPAASRVTGGSLGAALALAYYYAMYVWPTNTQTNPVAEGVIRNIIIAKPAFLYGELKLPSDGQRKVTTRMV